MTITKNNLKDLLKTKQEENNSSDFFYHGDYHTIGCSELSDIIDMLEDDTEYSDYDDIIDELQYNGSITEYADTSTPIYYSDIAKWFGENWSAVGEYIDEIGEPIQDNGGRTDIMRTIQGAYCMTYERDLQDAFRLLVEGVEEDDNTCEACGRECDNIAERYCDTCKDDMKACSRD